MTVTSVMSYSRALCLGLLPVLLAPGCLAAAAQLFTQIDDEQEAASGQSEPSVPTVVETDADAVNPDAIALAEALLPAADAEPVANADAAALPVAELHELELYDVTLEWVPHTTGYYYGYGAGTDPSKALHVSGRGKLGASAGEKAEVLIKASCDDGGYVVTDAELSTIDDSLGLRIPSPSTEFRISAKLFTAAPPSEPSSCKVSVVLNDPSRSPARRGVVTRCWDAQDKRARECTGVAEPTVAAAPETWTVADAQFLPTGELGMSVTAGLARVPDRIGLRATCNVGSKQFVEFKYLTGRWAALDPGDALRVHEQLTTSWEFTRFTDCDFELQDVGFDADKQVIRGTTVIARMCSRPLGVREGSCRARAPEAPAPDPSGMPAKLEIQHGGANAYGGWYNAYAMGELTVQAPLPVGTTIDFVAHCGTRTEKQQVLMQTGLELIYPGQSARAQGNVSFTGKAKVKSCTTEMVLNAKDADGNPKSWTLATQCYDKHGGFTPCPGAPVPTPTGLGLSGIGVGGIHKRSISGK